MSDCDLLTESGRLCHARGPAVVKAQLTIGEWHLAGVPWRLPHHRLGLSNLPSVGAIL